MSITFSALKTLVSRDIRDPNNDTFDTTRVGDLVNLGVVEVSKLSPEEFVEDIAPLSNTLSYQLRSSVFNGEAEPDIHIRRVEVWDGSTVPPTPMGRIWPAAEEYQDTSQAGWELWNGTLTIPNFSQQNIDISIHFIRVLGYSPYAQLVDDADVFNGNAKLQAAVREFAKLQAFEDLLMDRDLFTQWQTHTNNTDVSQAGLNAAVSSAQQVWNRRARAIYKPRF